ELRQDPAEAQGVLAQRRSHPVVAGGRRVALVEHEVDHLEHRGEAGGEIGPAGDLEGDARRRERALGPDDALRDGGLRDQESPRDLVGREAAEQSERERGTGLGREHRMTGREHEAQEIVADSIRHTASIARWASDTVTAWPRSARSEPSPASAPGPWEGVSWFHPTSILRKRSTASLGPKSSSSNSCRTSISPSLPSSEGLGKRRAHSMASSFDFTWMMV